MALSMDVFLRARAILSGLALVFLTALIVGAQQVPSEDSGVDSQLNCSDPSLAATAACASQTNTAPSFRVPQPGSSAAGENPTTPQVPPYYWDNAYPNQQTSTRAAQNQLTAPEPLTEFQKFVASSTGQVLPIFGADLFRRVPSTFAPLDLAPVPSNYVVGPGDELRIRVWGQVSFQANVRVDRSGDVYLPRIGPVHIAGVTSSDLEAKLRDAVGRVFRNFQLTVDLGQIRAIQVYVSGQARHPGAYTVSALSSLLDALFASGGPTVQGSLRRIQLRRDGKLVSEFDLYSLLTDGDKTRDAKLQSGDVLFIPPVGAQVAVTGSVRSPRIYELKSGETINDLLNDAGGMSAIAAQTRISIGRVQEHRDLHNLDVAFDSSGLATPLADGDIVHVYSILPRFQETVTLRGNIANPGKFTWHAGMHVSDLIPDKDSLLTRRYWWKRAQLGIPTPEFEADDRLGGLRQPSQPLTLPMNTPQGAQRDQFGGVSSGSSDQTGNELNPETGTAQNPGAAPEQRSASRTAASSSLAVEELRDEQTSAAQQRSEFRSLPKTEVRFLAPEIDWDYAAIERLNRDTLKTEVIPFDLGRLVLQHDASQNLELQPGDVVSIFSEADIRLPIAQQSKLVRLEGEFAHAGSYTAKPGETLRQLVERAGGLTGSAYLYGSEFRRESTRAIQQTRIDEYVRNLQMQMERGSLATAASAVSNPQDLASGTLARGNEQAIVEQLRQIRATGRIVLEFKADSKSAEEIPDVALENGDTFIVPSRPANVNVVGAVYDQNSFLYNPQRGVSTYLQLAGGPTRSADAKHAFVIRADGEVISRDATTSFWSNRFYNLALHPGDTVVVPEKIFKPSALRGVLDWSQVFSQFALGAAALSVLHN
jgi:protein involved in polysaccharide export with SLBB domain